MRIRRVEVENFKGIKSADWRIPQDRDFFCLIGPGDSSKSTLLEAMHLALSDRWNLSINDTDFFNGDTSATIQIRVAMADLPSELLQHNLLGFHLSGISPEGEYSHDPVIGFDPCVIIQLELDKDVEPRWTIFRPDHDGEPVPIGAGVRRRFDVFKVDDRIDIHLRWSKASALSRLTDATHGTSGTLATAIRAAREAVFESVSPELQALTTAIQGEVNKLGGGDFSQLRPGLDNSLTTSGGNLALFEASIPVANFGLGTRRLAGIATQQMVVSQGAVFLVDEVEHGLEPHRLVHLLRHFKTNPLRCQIFVTTHSSVAVEQLDAADLTIVRCTDGVMQVQSVPATLQSAQGSLRAGPSAFLARRIVVTEGKTEHGMLLGLLREWDQERSENALPPSAALGATIQDGRGGSVAPTRAKLLQELSYTTAVFVDHDDSSIDPALNAAAAAGAVVIRWSAGMCTETELAKHSDAAHLSEVLRLAVNCRADEATVLADLNKLAASALSSIDVNEWLTTELLTLEHAQALIGKTAKKYKWFKNVENGILLGRYLYKRWAYYGPTPFGAKIQALHAFIYSTESVPPPTWSMPSG